MYRLKAKLENAQGEQESLRQELEKAQSGVSRIHADRDRVGKKKQLVNPTTQTPMHTTHTHKHTQIPRPSTYPYYYYLPICAQAFSEVEKIKEEMERTQATLGKAQLQHEKLQNSLDKAQNEVDHLQDKLDKAGAENRRLVLEKEKLTYDYDNLQSQLDKALGQAARMQKERETLTLDTDRIREKLEKTQVCASLYSHSLTHSHIIHTDGHTTHTHTRVDLSYRCL